MVVVDGSPGSENAFEVAASVTDPARPLIVYHAQGFHPVIYMPDAPHVADHASFLNRLAEDKATKIMTHFEQKCRERNRNCLYVSEKSIDQASSVGSAICEYAEDHSVDTVFVGSRGMSTLQRAFMHEGYVGSVANFIARACRCDVHICKMREQASQPAQQAQKQE